jgi:hypothetical protein
MLFPSLDETFGAGDSIPDVWWLEMDIPNGLPVICRRLLPILIYYNENYNYY